MLTVNSIVSLNFSAVELLMLERGGAAVASKRWSYGLKY